jgi:hypothetical protein
MTASPMGRPLEPAIVDWLDLGPTEAPDRLSERILDTVEITPQRARRALDRRGVRVALLAAALAGAVVAGAWVAGGLLPTRIPAPTAVPPAPSAATATGPPSPFPSATTIDLRQPSGTEAALRARFVPSRAAACDTSNLVVAAQAAKVYRRTGINSIPNGPAGATSGLTSQQAWVTDTVPVPRGVIECTGGSLGDVAVYVVQFPVSDDSGENAAIGWPGTFFSLPDGSCDGSDPGYGRWPATGLPDGRVACWVADDGAAWVAWSDQRGKLLYVASRADGDLSALLTWWGSVAADWLEDGPV